MKTVRKNPIKYLAAAFVFLVIIYNAIIGLRGISVFSPDKRCFAVWHIYSSLRIEHLGIILITLIQLVVLASILIENKTMCLSGLILLGVSQIVDIGRTSKLFFNLFFEEEIAKYVSMRAEGYTGLGPGLIDFLTQKGNLVLLVISSVLLLLAIIFLALAFIRKKHLQHFIAASAISAAVFEIVHPYGLSRLFSLQFAWIEMHTLSVGSPFRHSVYLLKTIPSAILCAVFFLLIGLTFSGVYAREDGEIQKDLEWSNAHEIIEKLTKLKNLLDKGIITQEEFDARKKQLLGR